MPYNYLTVVGCLYGGPVEPPVCVLCACFDRTARAKWLRTRCAKGCGFQLHRLARNVAFIAQLLESNVDLVAVDMPNANRFMLHIMAAVAEQEARACSDRTKAALEAAKKRGVCLGWSNPKRQAEQRLASAKGAETNKRNARTFLEQMKPILRQCIQKGHCTPTAIAQHLNQQGIGARRGGIWHPSSAANLLKAIETEQICPTQKKGN